LTGLAERLQEGGAERADLLVRLAGGVVEGRGGGAGSAAQVDGLRGLSAAAAAARVFLGNEAEFAQPVHEFEEGFLAEVPQAEELLVRLLEHLADGHEAAALEAVVGAHGEVEVFDGGVVALRGEAEGLAGQGLRGRRGGAEVDEEAQLAIEDLGGLADGVLAVDGAVRPDFEDETVTVAFLTHAGGLHGVVDLAHGGEDGVHGDDADGHAVGVAGGDETEAALNLQGGGEAGVGGVQGGDVEFRVDDLVVAGDFEVGGGDGALTGDVEEELGGPVGEGAEPNAAEIEQQFGGVFLDVVDDGEFVLHLVDAHGDDGGAGQGAQQDTPERVADGGAEATGERLSDDPRVGVAGLFSGADALPTLSAVISMTAGTMFLIWLGELITEKGIGNGLSLIIFGGIIASFPTLFNSIRASDTGASGIVLVIGIAVVLVALIVFFQEAQRRIPVQYARSVFRGGRMYRQSGQSHIPLRVNSAGMIPLIFAFSIIIFPSVLAGWVTGTAGDDTATRTDTELLFPVDQADELTLAEAFPGIAGEGTIRINEGEIAWVAQDDSFRDVVDDINRSNQANVLTRIGPQTDPGTGEVVPTWSIESNAIGSNLIVIEDLEGDLIAQTGVRTHLDGPDDRLTVDVVEGQTIGERPGFIVRGASWVEGNFSPGRPLYWVLSFLLVVAFTFFYTIITFQQQNISENLQKQGGFVPGIRPGRPTQDYVNKVLIRITLAGALFLGFIAIVPFLTTEFIPDSQALTISSTGLLIVVGVALDTMKQVEAQLLMRNYEGFIR